MTIWTFARLLLLGIIGATASGCALMRYDAEREMRYYETAAVCCRSPADFTFEPIPGGLLPAGFDIDDRSPAFEFPTGKSPFRAFALPDASAPRVLTVNGFALYNPMRERRVFFPLVMLLDGEKKPLRSTGWNEMTFYDGNIEVKVPFGGAGDAARYAVVYTAPELVDTAVPATKSRIGALLIGKVVAPVPVGFDYTSRYGSYFGHISVAVGNP